MSTQEKPSKLLIDAAVAIWDSVIFQNPDREEKYFYLDIYYRLKDIIDELNEK